MTKNVIQSQHIAVIWLKGFYLCRIIARICRTRNYSISGFKIYINAFIRYYVIVPIDVQRDFYGRRST